MPNFGPDAARYIIAGQGERVARPFNLRWLLPAMLGNDVKLWAAVWWLSWPVAAAGLAWWGYEAGLVWQQFVAMPILCLALAGCLGPHVVRPVGVDLPAMALSIVAVAAFERHDDGFWFIAIVLIIIAAGIKETAPIWAALWVWNPLLLIGLMVPLILSVARRPQMDRITLDPVLKRVHDHPIRSSLEHHAGKWRDPRMVVQWGACLAAAYAPSWRVAAVTAAAYAQMLVATDTYRLIHTAAGPALAFAAVQVIPVPWLALACAVSAVWWLHPEFQ